MRAISAFVFTVIGLALFSLTKPYLDLRLEKANKTQFEYQEAILKSYQDLTTVAYEILNDTNLKQNIAWNLSHSNEGILRRYPSPGQISILRVVTDKCKLLAHAESGIMTGSPCLAEWPSKLEHPTLQWISQNEKALLALVMPFTVEGQNYRLLIGTAIDETWLNTNSRLKQLSKTLKLAIGTEQQSKLGVRLIDEGFDANSELHLASLYSQDWLLRTFPFLLSVKQSALNQLVFLLGVLTLILLFSVMFLLKSKETKLIRHLDEFENWVTNLKRGGGFQEANQKYSEPKAYLMRIRSLIKNLHDFHFQRDLELQARIDRYKEQYDKLEQDYLELEQKFLAGQRLESFHSQFDHSSQGFIALQRGICDRTETLADTISDGLTAKSKELHHLTSSWQNALQTVGSRKFIRSLAESQHPKHPASSQLEVAVQQIITLSGQIVDISLQTAIDVQKLLEELRQGSQIVEHWGYLHNEEDKRDQVLIHILQEGQRLIPLSQKVPDHRFFNHIDTAYSLEKLKLPHAIWVSLIYHLNMVLIESAKFHEIPEPILIQTHLRHRDQQTTLVVACESPKENLKKLRHSQRAQCHLDIIRQLLRTYSVHIMELPNLHGMASLALTWQENKSASRSDEKPRAGGSACL